MVNLVTLGQLIVTIILVVGTNGFQFNQEDEDPAVTRFRDYLRIPTNHPNPYPGYERAVAWIQGQAEEIGLDYSYVDLGEQNDFAVILTWQGSDPTLKSVLLNSHMDVVAVEPEKWIYPPFEAHKDENGNIYARGAGDMKSPTVGQLEAIRRLKAKEFQPLRTIHMTILPDEEMSGQKGMGPFVQSEHFRRLNVGIDIDEGGVYEESDSMGIRYAEKTSWKFNITARGKSEHASRLPRYTAGQRLQVAIDRLFQFRESEFNRLEESPDVTMDQITVLNLVRMGGGTGDNIIPSEVWASYNVRIRVRPGWNFSDVENMLLNIVEESRLGSDDPNDVTIDFMSKSLLAAETVANDSNIWWTVLQDSCREMNITCYPAVANGATDGRYVRSVGIPAFGVGPFLNTPYTFHEDNEFINEKEFLNGIERYEIIIKNLAMVSETIHP